MPQTRGAVIDVHQLRQGKCVGRGEAGYPTWLEWQLLRRLLNLRTLTGGALQPRRNFSVESPKQ